MRILIIFLLVLFVCGVSEAKYAVKLDGGNVTSYQVLSEKYLKKHATDPSNPLNQGYILVESLDGLNVIEHVTRTPIEEFLRMLDDPKVKEKIKKIK